MKVAKQQRTAKNSVFNDLVIASFVVDLLISSFWLYHNIKKYFWTIALGIAFVSVLTMALITALG